MQRLHSFAAHFQFSEGGVTWAITVGSGQAVRPSPLPKGLQVPLFAAPGVCKSLPAEPGLYGMQDVLLLSGRSLSRSGWEPQEMMLSLLEVWGSLPSKQRDGRA